MLVKRILGILVLAALLPAASAAAAPMAITHDQAIAAVNEVIRLVEDRYVFPQKRPVIAAALKKARDSGRYDVKTPQALSERLTIDLYASSADGHMSVSFDPQQFDEIKRHDAGPERGPRLVPRQRDEGRRTNDGYEFQKVLPGNVRYVRVSGFIWDPRTTPRIIDAAARFLSDGDAIIIDLRGNGGGSADAVERLVSYFFARGGQELMRFHDGLSGQTAINRVAVNLPHPRLNGKPMFCLIDGDSASAAEEFAYHVQQFKLGTLVGHRTAGAANNNAHYPVPPYFVASISVGRPEHPVSRGNWEGVGIAPDVEIKSGDALDQAHLLALRQLATTGDPALRVDYQWEIATDEAKQNPVQVAVQALDAYVGTYGIRRIWRDGATLMYQREKREPTVLIPMSADVFGFTNSPAVRLRFRRAGGRVVGFDQVTKDGVVASAERTG